MQFLGNAVRVRAGAARRAASTSSARPRATPAAPPSTRCKGKRGIEVFMLSPLGRMSPFQQAQMFSLQDANIHNIADRGRVRRLPGSRQGGLRRPRLQARARDRHRQLDQLGAPAGAGRLLLRRLFPGDDARTTRRSTSPCRPATSATSAPATSRARMGLPIRRLVLATNENDVLDEFFRTGALPRAQRRRDARDLEPVDGHLEGVELRALRLRCARPRRGAHARALRRGRDAARVRARRRRARARRRLRLRQRPQHRGRPAGDDPRRRPSASAR